MALNDAGYRSGAFVYVPRGVACEQPISLTSVQARAGALFDQRTLIVARGGRAGRGVGAVPVRRATQPTACSTPSSSWSSAENAHLRFVCGQDLSESSWIFGAQRAEVAATGRSTGSRSASARRAARCGWRRSSPARAPTAESPAPTPRTAASTSTSTPTQEHAAPNTTSDLAFRGVLQGRSSAVWRGNIIVDPGAQQTDAFQESRNLLLSKRAHADAIPGLEIQANDVRCTHAAAIAQIDPEQLFYLRSRGLREEVAKRLVIEGFLPALVERFEEGPMRDALGGALERRLSFVLGG